MKKLTAGLLAAILALGLTACGSKEPVESNAGNGNKGGNAEQTTGAGGNSANANKETGSLPTVDELISKTTDASIALKSFSMDAAINQNITMAQGDQKQEQKIDMKMKTDIIKEPMAIYQEIQMQMPDQQGNQTITQYITEDGIYSGTNGSWVKLPNEMKDQMMASLSGSMKPEAQLEQFKTIAKDMKITEEGSEYVMSADLSGDSMKEMAKSLMSQSGGANEQVAAMLDAMNIKNIKITYGVNKETYLPTKSDVSMTMDMEQEGQSISLDMVMTSTFSKHNEVAEIKVPEEALNAPSAAQ
ncbi:DUF6612 family protein [Paenibacillus spongiae]|uniref:LppX_LprAFG lipoprotein n=1 Tax=Paenibacillus spongiae TaxID=2909671 RepID=A0ABY5SAW9_9BACL|nr:DUF6612 family protein [Paenibacillus spongiae]UVI31067.1 hypothetical protein L1F29_04210 [Paenibacillus spongiae]